MNRYFKYMHTVFTKRYSASDENLQKIGGFLLVILVIFAIRSLLIITPILNFSALGGISDTAVLASNVANLIATLTSIAVLLFVLKRSKNAILSADISVAFSIISSGLYLFASDSYIQGELYAQLSTLGPSADAASVLEGLKNIYKISAISGFVITILFAGVISTYFHCSRRIQNILT